MLENAKSIQQNLNHSENYKKHLAGARCFTSHGRCCFAKHHTTSASLKKRVISMLNAVPWTIFQGDL
jgi:hypothetical protein